MIVPDSELIAILRQMNPWWGDDRVPDLPEWRRAAFAELDLWLCNPPAQRAVLLSGARQIGKTTLFLQSIEKLVRDGVSPQNVLYVTFDHPLLKLAGLEAVLRLWRSTEERAPGLEYLFIDEIQFLPNWQTWVKHQVDFQKERRIALTGSATPLVTEEQESGVGRWHTIQLATLSFYEFLRIKKQAEPEIPEVASLSRLFEWSEGDFSRISARAQSLAVQFHDYLQRGGFPQSALAPTVTWAQKLLREDIVDKVLKRDMTALFGVRRVVELEHTFLYLCLHDGGLLDMQAICKSLAVKKPTASNFIELLAAVHLIHKLPPLGYGKEVLRGRHKVYLADAAIGPSVLSKGRALLEDDTLLGSVVETAFFKHVFTRFYDANVKFSYWRGKKGHEVDLLAEVKGRLIPFEVKYRGQNTSASDLKGIREFCVTKKVKQGYVITRELSDFGILSLEEEGFEFQLLKIPAPLACYWLGRSELDSVRRLDQ
jgi:predicted AAA+ superfamily ATPase